MKVFEGTLIIPVRTCASSAEEAVMHNKAAARALSRTLDEATLGTVTWNTYEEVQVSSKVKAQGEGQ